MASTVASINTATSVRPNSFGGLRALFDRVRRRSRGPVSTPDIVPAGEGSVKRLTAIRQERECTSSTFPATIRGRHPLDRPAARLLFIAIMAIPAEAKGCIKGAIVGGTVGHFAGHHGLMGATLGAQLAITRPRRTATKLNDVQPESDVILWWALDSLWGRLMWKPEHRQDSSSCARRSAARLRRRGRANLDRGRIPDRQWPTLGGPR